MTSFQDWLRKQGLGHCGPILTAHGIDFTSAAQLTANDLRRLGLEPIDRSRFIRALADLRIDNSFEPRAAHAEPKRERRVLTVVYCDLVDSTSLARQLDPEDWLTVVQSYRSACASAVAKFEGEVAQVHGDGVLAYFGWPVSHEDDAERAVRASLAIVQAVGALETSVPLSVRISAVTGPVVVGGPSEAGYDPSLLAIGGAPNIAAKLQNVAAVNEVVIDEPTKQLLGRMFEFAAPERVNLKGVDSSLPVWRLLGVRSHEDRFHAVRGASPFTPWVGRELEMGSLMDGWRRVCDGQGCAVLLGGEPGIGKSRLTEALRERIPAESRITHVYQCSPYHVHAELFPVIARTEFVSGFTRDDSPEEKLNKLEARLLGSEEQRQEAASLLAALLLLPTERYQRPTPTVRERRELLFKAMLGQLAAQSQSRPVLVIFEDAHWADPISLELLGALLSQLAAWRVMLVITHRLHPFQPPWPLSSDVTRIELHAMSRTEGIELARNVADGKSLPAEVLDQLLTRADGVPLFIEELTKSVLESSLLREETGVYRVNESAPWLAIPTTLQALLLARLDRREGVRDLAQIGSCLGRIFADDVLRAVSGKPADVLDVEIDQLIRTELVFGQTSATGVTYTFKHALVQDAAYDALLKSKRQQLHSRIADVLEQQFPHLVAADVAMLARHRTQAGHLDAAIPLWRQAGESALKRFAFQEASAHLRQGLNCVDRLPASGERDALELSIRDRLHAALLQWRGWASPDVRDNARAMLPLARSQNRPDGVLLGLWGMWISTITQGRVAETTEWATRLLEEGTERRDKDLTILGHRAMLSSHFYLGELSAAVKHGNRALDLYELERAGRWLQVGSDVRTAVGVFSSQALWMLGQPDRAVALSNQKDHDARELGDPFNLCWALTWGAYVFAFRGEWQELSARADEADVLAQHQRIPVVVNALVPLNRGYVCLGTKRYREAIALLRQGIDGWQSTGGHLNMPYANAALAEALACNGELDAALQTIESSVEQIEEPGWNERVWLPEVLRLRGWIHRLHGNDDRAEHDLRASLDVARSQHAKSWELRTATTLAEMLHARGLNCEARALLEPCVSAIAEGQFTHDMRVARALLDRR